MKEKEKKGRRMNQIRRYSFMDKGRVLKNQKGWPLTKKGGGGRHQNQHANFSSSTNNEYNI